MTRILPRRVGFKKSRNGCTRCKSRHVKCDELQPCSNCKRHNASCSLVSSSPIAEAPSQHVLPTTSMDSLGDQTADDVSEGRESGVSTPVPQPNSIRVKADAAMRHLQDLTKSVRAIVDNLSNYQELESTALGRAKEEPDWLQDLQLLHHYSSSVYMTLAWGPDTLDIWKDTVLQLAFSRGYLMHALLALSALHLGHTNPDMEKECVLSSMRHQNTALDQFKFYLGDVSPESCHLPVLFAAFTFITSMFTVGNTKSGIVLLSDISQCFLLVQGVGNMLAAQSIWAAAQASPIGPLISEPSQTSQPKGKFAERLDELVELVKTMRVSQSMSLVDDLGLRSLCFSALNALQGMLATMLAAEKKTARIWSWPIMISGEFVGLVTKEEPTALVLLVHYAAMVSCYEADYWYLKGWSENVCRVVEGILVEEQWAKWVEWPVKCVRRKVDIRES